MPPPPPVWIDTQSENITSRHPSDAGGNNFTDRLELLLSVLDLQCCRR